MSNLGLWQKWWDKVKKPSRMGSDKTYRIAAEWLADCATVDDWGCGPGGAREYFKPGQYRGLDGTKNPFVDIICDLANHVSNPPAAGVLLRHVLEHDYHWRKILANALRSASSKVAIVGFVPMEGAERNLKDTSVGTIKIPNLALPRGEFMQIIAAGGWRIAGNDVIRGRSFMFGQEEYFLLSR